MRPKTVQEILKNRLGARKRDGFWNFDNAKSLVLYCNGSWCGQSPTTIKGLLKIGYPAHKILWYRGGMQDTNTLTPELLRNMDAYWFVTAGKPR